MNRFDKNFNDIDTVTHRPFSVGHPDGIWIISIINIFRILLVTLGVLMEFFCMKNEGVTNFYSLWPISLAMLFYLPPIVFLVRRDVFAFTWVAVGAGLNAVGLIPFIVVYGIWGSYLGVPVVLFPLVVCIESLFAWYIWGLKKDQLLK